MQQKEIRVKVNLDDKQTPQSIVWEADDAPDGAVVCKAFMLSLFDKEHMDTFKIDLWTKDFQIDEMDKFVFQTLRGITDSYFKATNNGELANEMQRFVQYFGEKTGIIDPAAEEK